MPCSLLVSRLFPFLEGGKAAHYEYDITFLLLCPAILSWPCFDRRWRLRSCASTDGHTTYRTNTLPKRNKYTNRRHDTDAVCVCLISCFLSPFLSSMDGRTDDQFNGGVVVVTHDARLIEATECRLWIVDEQEVTPWEGMIRPAFTYTQ